ncbi:hypothetical protein PXK00_09045 [Phaeobacter sp. QD34_3]|uniref:hypothetical protein n=1 Tax=unclassified Phaeobacter TaxID=2621772 RepID=UPI00237FCF57|nr:MULTISPECIES: hypothetical protein [unclassified Phaeobacter]MDE4133258.1 hypothetical protein [Phaeobacter sp. QD34_3]MDE4136955.1 hypothetical protein [Phaeobacter sp. QD34_24]
MVTSGRLTLHHLSDGPSALAPFPAAAFAAQDQSWPMDMLQAIGDGLLSPLNLGLAARLHKGALVLPCPRPDLAPVIEAGLNAVLGASPDMRPKAAQSAMGLLLAQWWNPREATLVAQAALARGIPVRWPSGDGSHLALGTGRFRRHIRAGYTDNDPARPDSDDKLSTIRALADMGLPIPGCHWAQCLTKAQEAARVLGFPVVLKPRAGAAQKSVHVKIGAPSALATAWRRALAQNPEADGFLIERHIEGTYLRATLINGLLAAYASEVPMTRGDGTTPAGALCARALGFETDFDACPAEGQEHIANVLAPQGLSPNSVPDPGQIFAVGYASDGQPEDVADRLHPQTRHALQRIAERFPSPALGVDLLLPAPSAPLMPPAAVIEVTSAPGFAIHEDLTPGSGADLANALLEALFPGPVRVPVLAYPAEAPHCLAPIQTALASAGILAGGMAQGQVWFETPDSALPLTQSIDALLDRPDLSLFCLGLGTEAKGVPLSQVDTCIGEDTDARLAACHLSAPTPGAGPLEIDQLVTLARTGVPSGPQR